jgi:hypothetical protein
MVVPSLLSAYRCPAVLREKFIIIIIENLSMIFVWNKMLKIWMTMVGATDNSSGREWNKENTEGKRKERRTINRLRRLPRLSKPTSNTTCSFFESIYCLHAGNITEFTYIKEAGVAYGMCFNFFKSWVQFPNREDFGPSTPVQVRN